MIEEMIKLWFKSLAENLLHDKMKAGFKFEGHTFPADLQAQTSALHAWDLYQATGNSSILGFDAKTNEWVSMDEATFKAFKLAGQSFVMSCFQIVWDFKRNKLTIAKDQDEAQAFYNQMIQSIELAANG
jgi:hypothetical protein